MAEEKIFGGCYPIPMVGNLTIHRVSRKFLNTKTNCQQWEENVFVKIIEVYFHGNLYHKTCA